MPPLTEINNRPGAARLVDREGDHATEEPLPTAAEGSLPLKYRLGQAPTDHLVTVAVPSSLVSLDYRFDRLP